MIRMQRTWLLAALAGSALVLAVTTGPPVMAQDQGHDEHPMLMVGHMEPRPDLGAAGGRNVRRARRLLRASVREAARFDTVAEARRLGYRMGAKRFRPGITHMRKNGTGFWGSLLDPSEPQALVFWCPSKGACALAASMYRAPGGEPPSTWGGIFQWHRHGVSPKVAWMTHVWLARKVRDGFAACAPMDALVAARGIRPEPYTERLPRIFRPCADEGDGDDEM
jgi:hypothetical protein